MQKWLIFSVFALLCRWGNAQAQVAYIRSFQDIAVAEMVRTGIPASIKLAQAMLESNCGKSDLACKTNNHFGIKCGGNWSGKSFHKEDDDFENGKLTKSCFREFNSVMDSYIAHSDFLTDPAKANRYGSLFQLEVTDYRGWAKGLSKAGYATDPQYAHKLIEIIEQFELFRFDNEYDNMILADSGPVSHGSAIIRYNNDVKYVLAVQGDNPQILARRHDVKSNQLLRFNDDILHPDQELIVGTKVYLQPKRATYHGKQKYHLMKQGEDMVSISQHYGIRLEALLKRNGLEKNETPLPKQKIMLKGKLKTKLRTADPYQFPAEKYPSAPVMPPQPEDDTVTAGTDLKPPSVNVVKEPDSLKPSGKNNQDASHTVAKGETLFGIARNYGLSVDELKKRNNLSADTIYIGQKLEWR